MSYRNPQIIVDRSAEIWAQGVGKIGETISAGITNYYKAKKLAKEKNDKLANANSKLLTEIQLNYNKSITDAKNAVKGSGVLQKQVRNNIQKIGDIAKEAHSMLATNPNISREQRASYLSAINNYNEYSSNTVSGSMKVSSGTEVLAQPITTLVNGYSPSYGDDLSSFIAANAVKEIAIPGITSSVTVVPTENNSNILTVNSKLKVDSDIYNAYKDAGIIDDKSYPEKDGYIDIKFERDLADWDGAFFDKIINAPDGNKALVDGGVKNKKGQINPKYVYSNLTTRTEGGLVYTEQVVDIASIQNSKAYNDIVKSQAAGLSIYDIKQQQQYIKGVLGWGDDVVKKYAEVDPKKKQNFLEDELKMKNIDMLGRRREVTDEDVKRIPGLSKTVLVGGEEQPNYIYTIPHGKPTAVEVEEQEEGEEEETDFKMNAAERAVNDLLEDPISYLTNIGGPDASGVADRNYDEETKILEFSMTDKGTGNKKMKKFDLSDKSQVKNLARTLFNFRGNKSLEVSENIDSVVDKIFDFSDTGDLPIF